MKRILIVGSYSPSLINFRGPLILALRARGYSVQVCAPAIRQDASSRRWLETEGITWHDAPLSRTGLNPFKDLRALLALIRLMRENRPDVFIGYTIKPVIWGLLASRIARVPKRVALITGLGYAFTGSASGKRALVQSIARRLYRLALRGAQVIFFQNPDDRADFARLGLLPEGATVMIVNGSGVNLQWFAMADLPRGPTKFLLIARLLGDKGIREFTGAAAILGRKWPGTEFHLVGGLDPNPNGILRSEIDEWVRAGIIVWHGAVDDVRPALAACHVYVLPSYREGTPRTVLEAMAMGRAVVTTDAPGCRETVEPNVNGFIVPPRDVAALVEAMEQFLLQPNLVPEMGAQSRRIAEEKYDVHKVNAAMLHTMQL